MSGFVFSPSQNALHIHTDGGVFRNDGTLEAMMQKTYVLAHLPGVMTQLGFRGWGMVLYPELCKSPTLDHILEKIEEDLRFYEARVVESARHEGASPECEIIIGGFSPKRGGMVAFMIGNHTKSPEIVPWKLREITVDMICPMPTREALQMFLPADGQYRFPRDAVAMMQAMRATAFPRAAGTPGSVIGCHIQEAIVTCDEVKTKIVHRWPDVFGQPINPAAGNVSA